MRIEKRRAPSFPKAPSIFDGGKPNSVPSPSFVDESLSRFASATKLELGDDHLSHPVLFLAKCWASDPATAGPRCDDTRGSTDRLSSLCVVLHRMGVFLPPELLRER